MNYGKSSKIFRTVKDFYFPGFARSELPSCVLSAAVSFLLAVCPLPLSVYPLGTAFFCASGKNAISAFVGLTVAAFFTELEPLAYLASSFIALSVRILTAIFIEGAFKRKEATSDTPLFIRLHEYLFSESLSLRVACSAIAVFSLSFYKIIAGGFRYYDLFGAIFAIFASSAAVLIFSGTLLYKKGKKTIYSTISKIAISAMICLSLSSFSAQSFNPALTVAFILTVDFCFSYGLPEAVACAVLCGAICGIENSAVLTISAFTAYCVLDISPVSASAVACIAGSICGVLLSGSSYMATSFLSLLLGCTLYSTLKKLTSVKTVANAERTQKASELATAFKLKKSEMLLERLHASLCKLSADVPFLSPAVSLTASVKQEFESETAENTRLAQILSHRLYELGFGKTDIVVAGQRRPKIKICRDRLSATAKQNALIRKQAENTVGFSLSSPVVSDNGKTLTMYRECVISYSHAIAQHAKEELCGDAVDVFFDEERNFLYAVICDGMGSGTAANSISTKALNILKSLILCGLDPENSAEILSELLQETQNSADELSTTVDIMRIDLLTGEGIFIKRGAAPGYIVRDGQTTCLNTHTLPLGILNVNETAKLKFSTKENDIIIMTSDGVAECESDSEPLCRYLSAHSSSSPKELVSGIIEMTHSNKKEDDVTVAAIKIFPQNY